MFQRGKYNRAALLYADSNRNFEEIALIFMQKESKESESGLEKYLTELFDRFKKKANKYALSTGEKENELFQRERTQRLVLSSWLLEIKLNVLEEAQMAGNTRSDSLYWEGVQQLESQFFAFIDDNLAFLDESTVF